VGQNPVGDSNIEKSREQIEACSQKEWAFLFLPLATFELKLSDT
jgi:hypothetical protein